MKNELTGAEKYKHIVLFCHHPFFINDVNEPAAYSRIEPEFRHKYLDLFNAGNVSAVFSGHYHNNNYAKYGEVELITTSAVGKPLGDAPSGIRIIQVFEDQLVSNYYAIEKIPESVEFEID